MVDISTGSVDISTDSACKHIYWQCRHIYCRCRHIYWYCRHIYCVPGKPHKDPSTGYMMSHGLSSTDVTKLADKTG